MVLLQIADVSVEYTSIPCLNARQFGQVTGRRYLVARAAATFGGRQEYYRRAKVSASMQLRGKRSVKEKSEEKGIYSGHHVKDEVRRAPKPKSPAEPSAMGLLPRPQTTMDPCTARCQHADGGPPRARVAFPREQCAIAPIA